jgi:hypothetical protein
MACSGGWHLEGDLQRRRLQFSSAPKPRHSFFNRESSALHQHPGLAKLKRSPTLLRQPQALHLLSRKLESFPDDELHRKHWQIEANENANACKRDSGY